MRKANKRVLNSDSTGKVRNAIRRNDNAITPYAAFEFFSRLPYEKGKDYTLNNNLKTTFKLTSTFEIVYAYGKQTPLGYAYMYMYQPGTLYDGAQGSKITSAVMQKNKPLDLALYA